jgi:NitT/TauT family transport system permease protein
LSESIPAPTPALSTPSNPSSSTALDPTSSAAANAASFSAPNASNGTTPAHTPQSPGKSRIALGWVGLLLALLVWWLVTHRVAASGGLAQAFTPEAALQALRPLVRDDHLIQHTAVSLCRVAVGLAWAIVIGMPVGLLMGRFEALERMFTPSFQFLRMVSPLSWMPIAVMSLGVGDHAVYFLLAFAAVWPIIMNTAHGVQQMDGRWIQLGRSLAATPTEMFIHIYLPGVAAHVLTGLRLAVGIVWIVLVPAEMLGVSAGLGYLILDTRDRLAYAELTATILVIGVIGFAMDASLRALYRRFAR